MNATITVHELQQLLASGSVSLIDVLLPEDYACRRIPGAGNACVYEMVFLEHIAECVPDKNQTVVVYDESGSTQAARDARQKLERAGYRRVSVLEGGLQAWRAAGLAVETVSVSEPPVIRDGVYGIDPEKSVVEWSGRNINNRHHGRIAVSEGGVTIQNGVPVAGSCLLDMASIINLDLQDEGWRTMLIRHLKSDDFFDVERYPTARIELKGGAAIAGATPGTPNVELAAQLTIKDVTRPICFPAIIAAQEDGTLKAQAMLDLDRTLWNVCYGSGKLYERLGMHLVNDLISIELFIVTKAIG